MRIIVLFLVLIIQSALAAVDGLNADGSLDRSKISKAYFEGDFDKVVIALETFRKLQPNPTKEDKIYAYKYLSVIYAAKPETRAKAESFMYQLLKLMPSIELMDLYISDNIEAIFNSVRLRFEHQSKIGLDSGQGNKQTAPASSVAANGSSGYDPKSPLNSASSSKPGKQNPEIKSNSHWGLWTAGVVGVAVVAAGYFILSEPVRTASAPPADTLDFK
jgi:hypothetical protein